MEDLRTWYLNQDWEKIEVITPRSKERISGFYDRSIEKFIPILLPNSLTKDKVKVYEFGSYSIWGTELPTLIVVPSYYALYYDPVQRRVWIFRNIGRAFNFARNMARRFD